MIATRNLTWQLPLLFALSLPVWRGAADRFLNPNPLREFGNSATLPSQTLVMEGVTFLQNRAGVTEWRLAAAQVVGSNGEQRFEFSEPRLQLLGRGEGTDRVAGRRALYDTELQTIDFTGQVEVTTGEGYELRTPEVEYRLLEKKLQSAAAVVFTGSDLRISGTSFQYDLESGNFTVGERVSCELW